MPVMPGADLFGSIWEDAFMPIGWDEPELLRRRAAQFGQGFERLGPQVAGTYAGQTLPMELANLEAAQATFPGYGQLQRDIGLPTANLNREIAVSDIEAMSNLSRAIDPEYYSTRSATAGAIGDLLRPGLSGGERTEIERALAQANYGQGTLNAPTSTSTVANAMTFGGAARDRLSQAVNLATQALPTFTTQLGEFPASGRVSEVPMQHVGLPQPGQATAQALGPAQAQLGQTQITGLEAAYNTPSNFERIMGTVPDY
jgi:hypothetical protein